MKLKFKGDRFIGAGLVLRGQCEVEVRDEIARILLRAYPELFEEVKGDAQKEEKRRKKEKEELETESYNVEEANEVHED